MGKLVENFTLDLDVHKTYIFTEHLSNKLKGQSGVYQKFYSYVPSFQQHLIIHSHQRNIADLCLHKPTHTHSRD